MDDADQAQQTLNDYELGPREATLVDQLPESHIVACHNLTLQYDRCLSEAGPQVTHERLKALLRRCEKVMDRLLPNRGPGR